MFTAILRTMRPRQWAKNVFVFAALVFDGQLFTPGPLVRTVAGFVLLCLASGVVYLVNDLADLPNDRQHPTKRLRPLAAGELSPAVGLAAAAALTALLLSASVLLSLPFAALIVTYVLLNVLYSWWLKHVPIIDVMVVASGFVLRVGAGVVLLTVERFSPWLYVCTTLLALFIGFGKRRAEMVSLAGGANAHRKVLDGYTIALLDHLIVIVSASTLMAYSLYTFSAPNLPSSHAMMLTIPFIVYGLFHYMQMIHVEGAGGAPEDLVLTDRRLQATVVLWGLAVIAILYTGR
jgi:4-hydroxybenzoate polyprenyltransferase